MALGTGLLIGSVAFELIDEALKTSTFAGVGLGMLVGAAVFAVGDWILDHRGAGDRKDMEGKQADGSPLAIVLGSVLDGIPESFVLGLTVLQGGVSVSLLTAVVLSNLPEGMASSSGLKTAGWPQRRVLLMWLAVVAVSAVASRLEPCSRCARTRCSPRRTRLTARGRACSWWSGFAISIALSAV